MPWAAFAGSVVSWVWRSRAGQVEGRKEALKQAHELSRTYTSHLEAWNRHRGK